MKNPITKAEKVIVGLHSNAETKSSSGRLIEQYYSDLQINTAGYQDFI